MYGIVHGGTDEALRRESAALLGEMPFDGYAVGGSLGEDRTEMLQLLDFLAPLLPDGKPTHLLGIGDPQSVAAVVARGIDTMDSCYPTRVGRHGNLFLTGGGVLKIAQREHADDFGPVDPQCETVAHSRAYLHHLLKQNEPLFWTLAAQHNLAFMNQLMGRLRERILNDEI